MRKTIGTMRVLIRYGWVDNIGQGGVFSESTFGGVCVLCPSNEDCHDAIAIICRDTTVIGFNYSRSAHEIAPVDFCRELRSLAVHKFCRVSHIRIQNCRLKLDGVVPKSQIVRNRDHPTVSNSPLLPKDLCDGPLQFFF